MDLMRQLPNTQTTGITIKRSANPLTVKGLGNPLPTPDGRMQRIWLDPPDIY
jgi:hypothetical protein